MLDFHVKNCSDVTVGIKEKSMKTKYGVVETKGDNLVRIGEKPSFRFKINVGIYIINPDIIDYIKKGSYFDMPDLINISIKKNRKVILYTIKER